MSMNRIFSRLFAPDTISYGSTFVKSLPCEKRKKVLFNQTLRYISQDYSLAKMPNWLAAYNGNHLGPYEHNLLIDILESDHGVMTLRGGARSGKSSTMKHLAKYAFDFTRSQPKIRDSLQHNSFIKIIEFDDCGIDASDNRLENDDEIRIKYEEKLSEEVAALLEEEFYESSILDNDPEKEDNYYNLLWEELFIKAVSFRKEFEELNPGNEYSKVFPDSYKTIRNVIRKFQNCPSGEKPTTKELKNIVNNKLNPKQKLIAKVLPYIRLSRINSRKLNSLSSTFILVLDNLDKLHICLQNYLYLTLLELFKGTVKDSGLSIVLCLRHGSFIDSKYRFSKDDLIAHHTPSPAEIIYNIVTDFLLNPEDHNFNQDETLSPEEKNSIIKRLFTLWFYLSDKSTNLYSSIEAFSGTNIHNALAATIEWLCCDKHPTGSSSLQDINDNISNIVSDVSFSNLLNQFCVRSGSAFYDIYKNHVGFTETSMFKLKDRRVVLNEMATMITSFALNVRLFSFDEEFFESLALRCKISYKLKPYFKQLFSENFCTTDLYKRCISGFKLGFEERLDNDPEVLFMYNENKTHISEQIREVGNWYSKFLFKRIPKCLSKFPNIEFVYNLAVPLCDLVSAGINAIISEYPIEQDTSFIRKLRWKESSRMPFYNVGRRGDSNKTVMADFMLSEYASAELFIKLITGKNSYGADYGCLNIFSNNGHKIKPIGLYILYILKSEINDIRISNIIERLEVLSYDEVDIKQTIISMLHSQNRMIYSSVTDHSLTTDNLLIKDNKLFLSWAGYTFINELVMLPVYQETVFENTNILKNKYIRKNTSYQPIFTSNAIMKRIEFSFMSLKLLAKDELDKFKICVGDGSAAGTSKLDEVRMESLGPVTDVFFNSSLFYYPIIGFCNSRADKRVQNVIKRFATKWYNELVQLRRQFIELYGDTNQNWDLVLNLLESKNDHLLITSEKETWH